VITIAATVLLREHPVVATAELRSPPVPVEAAASLVH
jgi:hypothetical protein